jgi:hypothetical protein
VIKQPGTAQSHLIHSRALIDAGKLEIRSKCFAEAMEISVAARLVNVLYAN